MDNIVLASAYRITATDYRISAEVLYDHNASFKKGGIAGLASFYFLVSHACELLLKSALLKRDVKASDLKNPRIRHNLMELLKQLESKGVDVSEQTKRIISLLSEQHQKSELRYEALLDNGKSVCFTDIPATFESLDELLMKTRVNN